MPDGIVSHVRRRDRCRTTHGWAERALTKALASGAHEDGEDSMATTNETKWTLGPWRFGLGGTDRDWPQVTVTGEDRELIIARLYEPDAESNARLIAAAPEMAEALRAILPWAEGNHDGALECDCSRCETVHAARAALAKAEGR
jgi:hypothetical protein